MDKKNDPPPFRKMIPPPPRGLKLNRELSYYSNGNMFINPNHRGCTTPEFRKLIPPPMPKKQNR